MRAATRGGRHEERRPWAHGTDTSDMEPQVRPLCSDRWRLVACGVHRRWGRRGSGGAHEHGSGTAQRARHESDRVGGDCSGSRPSEDTSSYGNLLLLAIDRVGRSDEGGGARGQSSWGVLVASKDTFLSSSGGFSPARAPAPRGRPAAATCRAWGISIETTRLIGMQATGARRLDSTDRHAEHGEFQ